MVCLQAVEVKLRGVLKPLSNDRVIIIRSAGPPRAAPQVCPRMAESAFSPQAGSYCRELKVQTNIIII